MPDFSVPVAPWLHAKEDQFFLPSNLYPDN